VKYIIKACSREGHEWRILAGPMDREKTLLRLSLYLKCDEDDDTYLDFKVICVE
jgi:hypothetical protein